MGFDNIKAAYEYAKKMHGKQERKFTGEAYIIHPENTAGFIVQVEGSENMVIAALLHDTLEDTDADPEYIRAEWGDEVLGLVQELTSDKVLQKKMGKKKYLTKELNGMTDDAFTVKLADRLSNILYLENERTPNDFIKWYTKETIYILDHLERNFNEIQEVLITRLRAAVLYIKNKRRK